MKLKQNKNKPPTHLRWEILSIPYNLKLCVPHLTLNHCTIMSWQFLLLSLSLWCYLYFISWVRYNLAFSCTGTKWILFSSIFWHYATTVLRCIKSIKCSLPGNWQWSWTKIIEVELRIANWDIDDSTIFQLKDRWQHFNSVVEMSL